MSMQTNAERIAQQVNARRTRLKPARRWKHGCVLGEEMTPEGKVKKVMTEGLDQLGAYWFFPATHGYGRSGVPDIIACIDGHFFGFECKAEGNSPTALQMKELEAIDKAGGYAFVVEGVVRAQHTLARVEQITGRKRVANDGTAGKGRRSKKVSRLRAD
jgi:Holliday junction resolvase